MQDDAVSNVFWPHALYVHVEVRSDNLTNLLCRLKIAGHSPSIIAPPEIRGARIRLIIGLKRINSVAARTLEEMVRHSAGVTDVHLEQCRGPSVPMPAMTLCVLDGRLGEAGPALGVSTELAVMSGDAEGEW